MEKCVKNPMYLAEADDLLRNEVYKYPYLTTVEPARLAELPPIPEGCEFDGIRVPNTGDYILTNEGAKQAQSSGYRHFVIVLKAKRWRAEKQERYYTINAGSVIAESEQGYPNDCHAWIAGWYWKTREEAEEALERMRKAVEQ